MAVQDFAIELIEELLNDKELALTEENIRFYDKGTTAETDESLDDHIRWRNARYYNADSNVIRSSLDSRMAPALSTAQEINGAIAAFYPGVQGSRFASERILDFFMDLLYYQDRSFFHASPAAAFHGAKKERIRTS